MRVVDVESNAWPRWREECAVPAFVGTVDASRHVDTAKGVRSWSELNSHEALDENGMGASPA